MKYLTNFCLLMLLLVFAACESQRSDKAMAMTDDDLLYQQAMKTLPDMDDIDRQVREYRKALVVERYIQEMVESHIADATDDECRAYYEANTKAYRLEAPIVKGILVKVDANSSKRRQLNQWMKQISLGNTDVLGELDDFCEDRAIHYDTFLDKWAEMSRLTDPLPVTVVDHQQFLSIRSYELTDDDYLYAFAITDYRNIGEVQPYEYALPTLQREVTQQKRAQYRKKLVEELRKQYAPDSTKINK